MIIGGKRKVTKISIELKCRLYHIPNYCSDFILGLIDRFHAIMVFYISYSSWHGIINFAYQSSNKWSISLIGIMICKKFQTSDIPLVSDFPQKCNPFLEFHG